MVCISLKMLNFAFDPCFKFSLSHHTEKVLLVLGLPNVKTTHRKSWHVNLLQVSNLTPASKSVWVIVLKRSYISLIIGSRASRCENHLQEIVGCESFASVKFEILTLLQSQVGASY